MLEIRLIFFSQWAGQGFTNCQYIGPHPSYFNVVNQYLLRLNLEGIQMSTSNLTTAANTQKKVKITRKLYQINHNRLFNNVTVMKNKTKNCNSGDSTRIYNRNNKDNVVVEVSATYRWLTEAGLKEWNAPRTTSDEKSIKTHKEIMR